MSKQLNPGDDLEGIFFMPGYMSEKKRQDPKVIGRLIRQEQRTERDSQFLDLQLRTRALQLDQSGICYRQTSYSDYSTIIRRIFGIGLSGRSNETEVFIAVNEEKDHPNPEIGDFRILRMQAYKIDFIGKNIVRSNPSFSKKPISADSWDITDEFGPYIAPTLNEYSTVSHWDQSRLTLPSLSERGASSREMQAQTLVNVRTLDELLSELEADDQRTVADGFVLRELL